MLPGVSPKAVGISRKETTPMSNSRVSTWSGIRNKLENDYLCPALRGHIQYFATSYSKSADHEGRAAIRVDGVEVLRSNYYTYFENVVQSGNTLCLYEEGYVQPYILSFLFLCVVLMLNILGDKSTPEE